MSADVCGNEGDMDQLGDGLPLIGQMAKLSLRRGDVLVLSTDRRLCDREIDRINLGINSFLWKIGLTTSIVPVLLLQEGMKLQVLDAQSLARHGAGEAGGAAKQI